MIWVYLAAITGATIVGCAWAWAFAVWSKNRYYDDYEK